MPAFAFWRRFLVIVFQGDTGFGLIRSPAPLYDNFCFSHPGSEVLTVAKLSVY